MNEQANDAKRFLWDLEEGRVFPSDVCRTQEIWVTPNLALGERITDTFGGTTLTLIRDLLTGEFFPPADCVSSEVWITPNMRVGMRHELMHIPYENT